MGLDAAFYTLGFPHLRAKGLRPLFLTLRRRASLMKKPTANAVGFLRESKSLLQFSSCSRGRTHMDSDAT